MQGQDTERNTCSSNKEGLANKELALFLGSDRGKLIEIKGSRSQALSHVLLAIAAWLNVGLQGHYRNNYARK